MTERDAASAANPLADARPLRPSQSFTQREPSPRESANEAQAESGAKTASPPVIFSALTTVWFGLATGLLELPLTIAFKRLRDPTPGFFRMNRNIVWIIPIADLLIFLIAGLALAGIAFVMRRPTPRFATRALLFLAFLTILLPNNRLHPAACAFLAAGLAVWATPRLLARASGFRRLVRLTVLPLALMTAITAGIPLWRIGFAEARVLSALPTASTDAPNVLMIVLDTVRADHLSVYGYERKTTPNLERLANRGTAFNQARSTAPWTLPSHASLMTGRWPHELSASLDGPLDAAYPTLAEQLANRGYATGGFVANINYCGAETGLARGFSRYEDHDLSPMGLLNGFALGRRVLIKPTAWALRTLGWRVESDRRKKASAIVDRTLNWIDQRGDRPFFAFLNFFDAHDPYFPPFGYKRQFGAPLRSSEDINLIKNWFAANKKTMTPQQIQLGKDAYDDCIAYLDGELGRFFDALDQRRLTDDTIIVVTADHGEHFGEHNLFGHASSLYSPETRVPLLVAYPKAKAIPAGHQVERPVSIRDVASTIMDLAGFGESSPLAGRSLSRYWRDSSAESAEAEAEADPLLTEVDAPVKAAPNHGRSPVFRGAMKAVVAEDKMYIRNGDGVEELYDIESDPVETRNLADSADSAPILERFRRYLQDLTRSESAK